MGYDLCEGLGRRRQRRHPLGATARARRVDQSAQAESRIPSRHRLAAGLRATHDAVEALRGSELVAFAIPSQSLRDNLTEWVADVPDGATLVSLMKGVELGTTKRMSEVIAEVTGAGAERVAVVSGPNLAL